MIDHFSKFADVALLYSKTADEVVKAIAGLLVAHDPPSIIQTDNGKEFINSNMKDLLT
jgi:hypothetical protein